MTVAENLRTAREVSSLRRECAEYLVAWHPTQEDPEDEEREELIERFELGDVLDESVEHLPIGIAKMVELACVLLRGPRLLLLDEPSSGLDHEETARLGEMLLELQADRELSILMIEHDMSLAMRLCEYLYVLDFGSLIAEGPPESVRQDVNVIAAYLGQEVA